MLAFMTMISVNGCTKDRFAACNKFTHDLVPFNLGACSLELLNAASGVTSSRRGEVDSRKTQVSVWSSHVSPSGDKVFAIILEREPNPRDNPANSGRMSDTLLYCFSVAFAKQSDGSWLGHILQNVYFVGYLSQDSLRLQHVVCKAYFDHDSEHSGYCLPTGVRADPKDRSVISPHDSGFFSLSPIWEKIEQGLLKHESFRFVGDSAILKIVKE